MNRRDFLKTSAAIAVTAAIPMDIMAIETKSPFIDFAEKNFKINHWKKELAKIYDDERFVLVKKYRQGGFTTMSTLYALHQCLTKEKQSIGILSKTDHQARCVKDIFNFASGYLPMNPAIVRNNERYVEFKNGNRISFLSPIATCGCAFTIVIFDEPAFWEDLESHYQAIYPTISNGGKMFMVSTPNRTRGYFYKLWETDNRFRKYAPSCFEHPNYTPERIASLKGNLGEKGWKQECLAEFQDEPY